MNSPTDMEFQPPTEGSGIEGRIIRRFGGRHLIFRTRKGGWPLIPRPYLLISGFRGPIWVFYGIGQIWLTHRKVREIGGWLVRAPRIASRPLVELVNQLELPLGNFIEYCEEHGIEGSIVMEKRTIEFHWMFGVELDREKDKPQHCNNLDAQFHRLVASFSAVTEP